MPSPDRAFSIYGGVAALSWFSLAASLFVPDNLRVPIWAGTALVVPVLVGLAYALLLAQGLRARTGGGFGSIASVRRLFANDAALAAGWLHYIAFDLFVGTWVAQAGLDADMSPLVILPCLLLTFLRSASLRSWLCASSSPRGWGSPYDCPGPTAGARASRGTVPPLEP
ncbi:abscisic acid-deficient protein Aba4 family protein [Lichenihabitans psoromatis]|uniref:abscisic acid-deficient protein Aba4 family protein n=1 Tax=Lichenihabitans psoromatis TaxID=2528642 RepID=UPI00103662F1|nr:abscisic acid-deficient protein Aba4 family protein [Lichenihabitans psoromatis]